MDENEDEDRDDEDEDKEEDCTRNCYRVDEYCNDKDEKDTVTLKRGETLTFMEVPTTKNDKDEKNTGENP